LHAHARLISTFLLFALLAHSAGHITPARAAADQSAWTITTVSTTTSNLGYTAPQINDAGDVLFSEGTDALFLAQGGVIHTLARNTQVITEARDATSGVTVTINATPRQLNDFLLDNLGRAYLRAATGDGRHWVLRWERGVFTRLPTERTDSNTSETAFDPMLALGAKDGRWVELRQINAGTSATKRYRLTDGLTSTPVVERTSTNTAAAAPCDFLNASEDRFSNPRVSAQGVLYFLRDRTVSAYDTTSGFCGPLTQQTRTTTIQAAGAQSATLASGSYVRTPNPNPPPQNSVVGDQVAEVTPNDAGDVGFVRIKYGGTVPGTDEWSIASSSGPRVLQSFPQATLRLGGLIALTPAGTLFGSMSETASGILGFYAVNSAGAERIVHTGQTLSGLGAITLHETRGGDANSTGEFAFVFRYTGPGNATHYGIGKATRGVTRWTNAGGGAWSAAGNWSPAEVPGAASETVFDLSSSYDVNVGARSAGRSSINAGSVGFRSAELTLTGPLAIGRNGALTVPEGRVIAGEITIGSLPPESAGTPTLARLTVSNNGTVVSTTGSLKIGTAGDGELFVSDAKFGSTEVQIGAGSTGTATVGGAKTAYWEADSMLVGAGHNATLNIERDATLYADGQVVIGGGTALSSRRAVVNVDGAGGTFPAASMLVSDTLTIGDAMFGELHVRNTASVVQSSGGDSPVQLGVRAHNAGDAQPDALLTVTGASSPEELSVFRTFGGIAMGMTNGTNVRVEVRGGGRLLTGQSSSLGHEAGSTARLIVSGVGPGEVPSEVVFGPVDITRFDENFCEVGRAGTGFVRVDGGGKLTCRGILTVGMLPGSRGLIVIDGVAPGGGSASNVTSDILCVGKAEFCTQTPGRGNGEIALRNGGSLGSSRALVVGDGGRISGSGTVAIAGLGMDVEDGGSMDPGIQVLNLEPLQRTAQGAQQVATPGTLTISGSLTMSATAVLTIDITSKTDFDTLVVNGPARLGGKLVLNFSNGYAPRQGDAFAFVRGTNLTGQFDTVEIAGLAPGFQFSVSSTGGATTLVANNDGVAATQRVERVLLPVVRK
jgi:T5SS/PEP-CTERM-associated repeat protein